MMLLHGVKVDVSQIKESIKAILDSGIKYEFRTTVYPKYVDIDNVKRIAQYLQTVGCKEYVIQNYFDFEGRAKPYSQEKLEEMVQVCSTYLPTRWRGIVG